MTTKFIGVKEFRANVAKFASRSAKNNERYIILRHNKPILEVRPLSKNDSAFRQFELSIQQGLEDIKHGRVHTHKQVKKALGLK